MTSTRIAIHNDGSELWAMTYEELKTYDIQNWKYNRPPSRNRISELAQYFSGQNYMDGLLYLACLTPQRSEKSYICYDGIHRLEALRCMNRNDMLVYIHIIVNPAEDWLKRKFERINSCIPVPEMYTDSCRQLHKIRLVETITQSLMRQYPTHFKNTRKPKIPHISRDILMDGISEFVDDFSTVDSVLESMDKFNQHMKENLTHTLTPKQLQKCVESGCFLFTTRNWIEQLIQFGLESSAIQK